MKKQKKVKKRKEKTVSQLVKELDRLFSLFIRNKYPKQCYTCGYKADKLHCGHYISRFYKQTRWDERNCRPQCVMCNLWKRGDPVTFRAKLVDELGSSVVEQMEDSRKQITKHNREDLLARIASFTEKP